MRKIILGAVAAAAAMTIAPASAEPGNGCQAAGANAGAAATCTYTSTGAATSVLVLTPNHVDVTYVDAEGQTITVYSNDSADPTAQGVHETDAIPAGEEVTVTMGPDDAEVVEGHIGIVIIAETA